MEPKWGIRLCWEWQLGAEVGDWAVLGVEAQSRMVESSRDGSVGSSSSELKWGIRLCLEQQLGAEWWS